MSHKTKQDKHAPAGPAEAASSAAGPAAETGDNALAELQSDLDRFKDLALRSAADLDNLRKRTAREKEDTIRFANTSLLERLVPIIDNFELGLAAARQEGEQSPVFQGLQMVAKQLQDFLADQGVQPVDAVGQKFDPNFHEAMTQMESADAPEGVVIQQIRKGYKLRERLLRAAAVIVSKGKPQA